MSAKLLRENSMTAAERIAIRQKLLEFYNSVPDYAAFESASDQSHCWLHVYLGLQRRMSEQRAEDPLLRVLEIGSGRSGLGSWLTEKGLRDRVHLTAHDVTSQNVAWLKRWSDDVVIGDLDRLSAIPAFDVIVSTYVLEHVPDPTRHLDLVLSLLRANGSIFLFCPRYDFPGYLCPSARHLCVASQVGLLSRVVRQRIVSFILQRPAFLIQTDLAAFHGPFFTDADAVHWVSLLDLRLWARRSNLSFRRLVNGNPKRFTKDWVVKRFLTCAVELRKGWVPH
jgi:2-polyprenyl-3-methyl-5-hydroxy-6-metoxy-1,4-benzoquinol methylase